jgi:hypothetical protein
MPLREGVRKPSTEEETQAVEQDAGHETEGPRFRGGAIPAVQAAAPETEAPLSASDRAFAPATTAVRGKPIDIDYIANTPDVVMVIERLFTIGEVTGSNVFDMIEGILAKAQGRPIRRLTITGHGSPGSQEIGTSGSLHNVMGPSEKRALGKLHAHFSPDAEVVLHGCEVAGGTAGEQLLVTLSQIWGVPVRGGVAPQRGLPGLEGNEVLAQPDAERGAKVRHFSSPLHSLATQTGSFTDDNDQRRLWESAPDYQWENASTDERYNAVKAWTGGYTSKHEGELIVKMFGTAKPADRKELYRLIEGHAWGGDFRHGILVSDDSLWNSLTSHQVETLRGLLNQS